MRIVILHTDFRIYWPARIKALHTFLESKGIELIVVEIAGAGSPYAFAEHAENNELIWHILFPYAKMEELKGNEIKKAINNKLNELSPDIIIAGAIAFPSGALSTAWAKKNRKKIIIFDDAKASDVQRSNLINFIKQNIYNGVDAMIYPSIEWEETGLFWKFKKEQLFYGLDVVDNSFWQQNYESKIEIDQKYFLSIGRHIPDKNFTFMLNAYKDYKKKFKEKSYKLVLVGEGNERAKIETFIHKNQLSKDVILLSFLQQRDLIAIYHKAEAFIIASKQETWGLVINEAMACGLPIIASEKCGATRTLVKENINGYTFSPFDEKELTEKLCCFHSLTENDKKRMKEASLKIISDWNLDRFTKSCHEAIQYVNGAKRKKISILSSIMINFWKGRYRPI